MSANTRNLLIDVLAFAGLILAAQPSLSGAATHEWIGIALTGTLLVHLLLHGRWVANVVSRFLSKLQATTRLNAVVDLAIFAQAVVIAVTGFAMSHRTMALLGATAAHRGLALEVHEAAGEALVLFVALHLFLHRAWIAQAVRRLFTPGRARRRSLAPVPVRGRMPAPPPGLQPTAIPMRERSYRQW